MKKTIINISVIFRNILVFAAGLVIAAFLLCCFTGFRPVVVISGSMEPAVSAGSVALIDTKAAEYKKGDIAAFRIEDKMITHRIEEINEEGFITKGDANAKVDPWVVRKDQMEGITRYSIPKTGYFVRFISSAGGIAMAVSVLILLYITSAVLCRKND